MPFNKLIKSYEYKPDGQTETAESITLSNDEIDGPQNRKNEDLVVTARRKRLKRTYAHPSKYAHLGTVPEYLRPDLKCIFIGLNPGIKTAELGHYWASNTNWFWKLVNESGIVPETVTCYDDARMPSLGFGMINIITRCTASQEELSWHELVDAVRPLENRIQGLAPVVAVVGKGIWDAIYYKLCGRKIGKQFTFGLQPQTFAGAKVFVLCSTSGRVAAYSYKDKLSNWLELRRCIESHHLIGRDQDGNTQAASDASLPG